MTRVSTGPETTPPLLGALVRRLPVRIIDISAVGCLLESGHDVAEGTVALLGLEIEGHRYVDPIRICRAVRMTGGVRAFRLGADFLMLAPPSVLSLRRMAALDAADLVIPAAADTAPAAGDETEGTS